jgi:hypothetical protein
MLLYGFLTSLYFRNGRIAYIQLCHAYIILIHLIILTASSASCAKNKNCTLFLLWSTKSKIGVTCGSVYPQALFAIEDIVVFGSAPARSVQGIISLRIETRCSNNKNLEFYGGRLCSPEWVPSTKPRFSSFVLVCLILWCKVFSKSVFRLKMH